MVYCQCFLESPCGNEGDVPLNMLRGGMGLQNSQGDYMANCVEIYCVRHGQTIWNTEKRIQGWMNSPLTALGIEQAVAAQRWAHAIPWSAVYTSPSPRAMETVRHLMGAGPTRYRVDARLLEMGLGVWQGHEHSEIERVAPRRLKQFYTDPLAFHVSGGETFGDVMARVRSFMQTEIESRVLKGKCSEASEDVDTILVVTHGITQMMLAMYCEGAPLEVMPQYKVGKNVSAVSYMYSKGTYTAI